MGCQPGPEYGKRPFLGTYTPPNRWRELRAAIVGWIDAWWRRFTRHDLKGDLQIDCRAADRDLRDAVGMLFQKETPP